MRLLTGHLLLACLLQAGRSVEVPVYDFTKHARSSEVRKVPWGGKGYSWVEGCCCSINHSRLSSHVSVSSKQRQQVDVYS